MTDTTERPASDSTAPTDDSDGSRHENHQSLSMLAVGTIAVIAITEPVAAADGLVQPSICTEPGMDTITGLISGWVEIAAALGSMMMVAVWQADALAELLTGTEDGKKRIKRHKRTVAKAGLTVLVLGPGVTVAGKVMGIPFLDCVDLIPF